MDKFVDVVIPLLTAAAQKMGLAAEYMWIAQVRYAFAMGIGYLLEWIFWTCWAITWVVKFSGMLKVVDTYSASKQEFVYCM